MKTFKKILTIAIVFVSTISQAQLFKNAKPALAITSFYNTSGDYVYLLNQDASLSEVSENHFGFTSSLTAMIPLSERNIRRNKSKTRNYYREEWYFVGSAPLLDFNIKETEFELSKQIPVGLGVAFFPWEHGLGFIANFNFGSTKRMREQALQSQRFPIMLYPTLSVNTPVPDEVLDPYKKRVVTVSFNLGIVVMPRDFDE